MARRDSWTERLLDDIAAHRRVLVVLDYDGTLVPMRARPHLAILGASERSTLRKLDRGRSRLAIMSGRAIADLRERVGVEDILYGGVFGLEIAGPGWRYVHPRARAMHQRMSDLMGALGRLLGDIEGTFVEDKGVGITVHYRNVAPVRHKEFERRMAHARAAAPRGLIWRRGRMAWEILPRTDWDKGTAAKLLWRRLNRPFMLVIGDERYDEPMLRAAAHHRGVGVRVGRGSTEARHHLRDSFAVRRFLHGLTERLAARPPGAGNARFSRRLKTTARKVSAAGASSRPVGRGRGSGRSARRPGRSGAAARG